MKQKLMHILACPVCKGDLQLTVEEERDGDVRSGSLFCSHCQHSYPIVGGIPNLLPPDEAEAQD